MPTFTFSNFLAVLAMEIHKKNTENLYFCRTG